MRWAAAPITNKQVTQSKKSRKCERAIPLGKKKQYSQFSKHRM
jgi:hypothetical protein